MPEDTKQEQRRAPGSSQRAHVISSVETVFRQSELNRFIDWVRQGPESTCTWAGEHWQRLITPKQHLAMAVCQALGLKVLQQNPHTTTTWAQLARERHDVWQVLLNSRYVGVVVNGSYRSYDEIRRSAQKRASQPRP